MGRARRTVTLAPRRRQTEPSSRPMTPPPITIRWSGTFGILRAPTFESTRSSSNLRNGSSTGTEPVAMMTCLAWYSTAAEPSPGATDTTLPAFSVPRPLAQVTLFLRNRYSMPRVFAPTTSSLRFSIWARSRLRPVTVNPCSAAWSFVNSKCSELREERFRWNAADVHAGAAQRRVHFDADGGEAALGRVEGGDVAPGPPPMMTRSTEGTYSTSMLAGSSISSLIRTRKSTAC